MVCWKYDKDKRGHILRSIKFMILARENHQFLVSTLTVIEWLVHILKGRYAQNVSILDGMTEYWFNLPKTAAQSKLRNKVKYFVSYMIAN